MEELNPKRVDNEAGRRAQESNLVKDPEDWVTADEPMTGAQASYLKTLSEEAGAEFEANLTKADASKQIEELQHQTGRGQ